MDYGKDGSLNGFIREPCIACFSMGIALRNEIQTYTDDNRIEAEVLPEQKSAIGRQLQTEGLIVTMKSAGITLIKGDLRGSVRLETVENERNSRISARTGRK